MDVIHRRIRVGLHESEMIAVIFLRAQDISHIRHYPLFHLQIVSLALFTQAVPFFSGSLRLVSADHFALSVQKIGRVADRQILHKICIVPVHGGHGVPHLQEHHGQALYGVPFQADAGIFPESEGLRHMEIFVGEIISPCVTYPAVDDRDLAVVAVVEEQVQAGQEGIEHTALDPIAFRTFDKVHIDKAQAPHIIIKDPDLDPGFSPLCQNVPDRVPALRVLDGMVLHENEFLRFGQILFLGFDSLQGIVIILDPGILIDRKSGMAADIFYDSAQVRVPCPRVPGFFLSRRQDGEQDLVYVLEPPAHFITGPVQADEQVEQRPEDRQRHDHEHPCHADRRCFIARVNGKHQK